MVGKCLNTIDYKRFSEFLNPFSAEAINDTWFAGVLLDVFNNFLGYIIGLWPYFIVKIWTVEGWFEDFGFKHIKVLLNILLHFGCRSGSKSHDWYILSDGFDNGAESAIFRAEIMPPFRNTVGFIDSVETDIDALEKLYVILFGQWFRRNIQ